MKGRQKEAIQVLDVLARRNGSKLPTDVEIKNIHEVRCNVIFFSRETSKLTD